MKNKNKKNVFFSIIIPTFNRANLIHIPIKSVIEQSYNDWELIIVDDGSTDHTKQVVQAFKDDRIQYFYKKNEERSIARNFGIAKANGKYLCFLDSDDYYLPNHLDIHFKNIQKYNYPVASFFSGSFMESNGKKEIDIHLFANDDPIRDLWKYGFNLLPFSYHKDIFLTNKLDPRLVFMEDVSFTLNVFKKFKVYPIFTPTNVIVVHPERSIDKCYKTSIFHYGNMQIYSINTIIQENRSFLEKHMSSAEITKKKKVIILSFFKACIKKLNPFCALHFFKKYIPLLFKNA